MPASQPPSADAPPAWQTERAALTARIVQLEQQLAWFKRQLFGEKSERRLIETAPEQMSLGELFGAPQGAEARTVTVNAHHRRHSVQNQEEAEDGCELFFDDQVPVQVIELPNPACEGLAEDEYSIVSEKVTHRLAQRPGSYVVLKYVRRVIKRTADQSLHCAPAPPGVFEGGRADVSFLAGLVIEKFRYHLPLYRQHQRLADAGIRVSRAWLTTQVHRVAALLAPIVEAQLASIRASRVKAMDETPIKAGRKGKGKLNSGFFWPVYGERDELVFLYQSSRAARHVHAILGANPGEDAVLLSDGYSAYAHYAERTGITHAQCWAHTRRKLFEALEIEPEAAGRGLEFIGELYACEKHIRQQGLDGEPKRQYRLAHAAPVVAAFFAWAQEQLSEAALLPSNPLTGALNYALQRREGLQVYLADPDVPIDTNHLERALRPIPLGRKNWKFCWTEVGAEAVGILQSLLSTCTLQGVNAYDYLIDVLQRIDRHPASEVHQLTPRLWKQHFADSPLRSDVHNRSG